MARRSLSMVGAAVCFVAGCTGILYGESDAVSNDDRAPNGTAGDNAAHEPKPVPSGAGSSGGVPAESSAGGLAGAGGAAGAGLEAGIAGADSEGGQGWGGAGAAGAGAIGGDGAAGGGGGSTDGGDGSTGGGGADGAGLGGTGSEAGAGGDPPLLPGDPSRGFKLVVLNNCYRCHGSDLSGRSYFPNITPDEATGVGSWTDEQLGLAIRGGINAQGELLCAAMPIYSGLKPQGLADMVAFLRSIPPKYNSITDICPGHAP